MVGLYIMAMTAYVLSRKDFIFRNHFSFFFFFTTLFSGGMVVIYIWMIKYLGMSNKFYSLILPGIIPVMYIIIMRSFISNSIPDSLTESAKIDGAGEYYIFWKIVIPLLKPALASIGLFKALNYWNDWSTTMLYIRSEKLYSLQYLLYKMMQDLNYLQSMTGSVDSTEIMDIPSESFKLAMTVVAIGPIIFLYPFVQKYFIQGMTIGAVKG
jgi:putative aldouronate transport system permease protein